MPWTWYISCDFWINLVLSSILVFYPLKPIAIKIILIVVKKNIK